MMLLQATLEVWQKHLYAFLFMCIINQVYNMTTTPAQAIIQDKHLQFKCEADHD